MSHFTTDWQLTRVNAVRSVFYQCGVYWYIWSVNYTYVRRQHIYSVAKCIEHITSFRQRMPSRLFQNSDIDIDQVLCLQIYFKVLQHMVGISIKKIVWIGEWNARLPALRSKTSFHQISESLKAARPRFRAIWSLKIFSVAIFPRRMSNFKSMRQF